MKSFSGEFQVKGSVVSFIAGPCPAHEGQSWIFRQDFHDQDLAVLVKNYLAERLENLMENERKKAYDKGWKDAKSKKVSKKSWFSSRLWKEEP